MSLYKLIRFLPLFIATGLQAQNVIPVNRGSTSVLARDAHAQGYLTAIMPVVSDTTAAHSIFGVDSIGMYIAVRANPVLVYFRDTTAGGHKWTLFGTSGSPGPLATASGDAAGTVSGTNLPLTLATVNSNVFGSNTVVKITINGKGLITAASAVTASDLNIIYGYTPLANGRNLTINGVTLDLTADRSWTINDANLPTSDITTNNASTSKHGFLRKLDNDPTHYLDGQGNLTVPPGSASSIAALTDVSLTSLANKQLLQYNSVSSKWENKSLFAKADGTTLGIATFNATRFTDNGSGVIDCPTCLIGSATNKQIAYGSGSGTLTSNSSLIFDNFNLINGSATLSGSTTPSLNFFNGFSNTATNNGSGSVLFGNAIIGLNNSLTVPTGSTGISGELIVGNGNSMTASSAVDGGLIVGTSNTITDFQNSMIIGETNFALVNGRGSLIVGQSNANSVNAGGNMGFSTLLGHHLIYKSWNNPQIFVGQYNDTSKTSVVFGIGTGNSGARKTAFYIDSLDNMFLHPHTSATRPAGAGGLVYYDTDSASLVQWTGSTYNKVGTVSGGSGTPQTPQTLTDGATITWTRSSGLNAKVTLGGNRTLAISGIVSGDYGTLQVNQDGTGSRTLALPSGSLVVGGGGGAITLSTAANSKDILTFYYDGTNYFWSYGLNFN